MTSEESRDCSEPQVHYLINGDSDAFVLVLPGYFMLSHQKRRSWHQHHRVHWDAFFHTPQCPTHLVTICVFHRRVSGFINFSSKKAWQRGTHRVTWNPVSKGRERCVRLLWVAQSQQGLPPIGRLPVGRRVRLLGLAAKSIHKFRKSRDSSLQ